MFFGRNNVFYKNIHENVLDIFEPTIRTWWNVQIEKLKDDLMNHMVSLFGESFNKKGVTATTGLNLKYVRVDYRENLQINTKYECFLMVPEKEWKALMDDENENALRKEGNTRLLYSRSYDTYHIFNEKCSFILLLNIFKLQYLTYLKPFIGSPTPLK